MYMCVCACICTYIYIYVYMYIWFVHVCVCISCIHIYIYIYVYIYIHTFILYICVSCEFGCYHVQTHLALCSTDWPVSCLYRASNGIKAAHLGAAAIGNGTTSLAVWHPRWWWEMVMGFWESIYIIKGSAHFDFRKSWKILIKSTHWFFLVIMQIRIKELFSNFN